MKIIDLSISIHEGMQTYPSKNHPFVEINQLARHGIENRETRKLVLGSHTGTHIDAPRHFIPDGNTTDNIPLDVLIGKARILNCSDIEAFKSLSLKDLIKRLGNDQYVERLLIRFDGCKRLGKMSYYTDQPWLEEETAEWLVDNNCKLLGLDVAMPDNPKNSFDSEIDSPIHKILLKKNVVILEYLTNLSAISKEYFQIVVAPLKIANSDGAPARCFALED